MGDVTVLGLGAMGSALAGAACKAGHDTVIWNRTASRADPLVAAGARFFSDPVEAIAQSPIAVVCVSDYSASDSVLTTPAAQAALKGRVLVQLSSGSPRLARAAQAWAQASGVVYLDGAIMVFPSGIGKSDALILIAGDQEGFKQSESLLRVFAPGTTYMGADAGLASTLDEALLSAGLGLIMGVVNGAALCEAGGLPVSEYSKYLEGVLPTFVNSTVETARKIGEGNLEETEASLQTWGAVLEYMSESAADAGFSNEIPSFIRSLFNRAIDQGLGEHDVAALIRLLRPTRK
ncbi:MAG: NAD(P)-binding domain-containing protein [bacterium]|nr:NAD(P)-binding domain-containing protein [bacterium]